MIGRAARRRQGPMRAPLRFSKCSSTRTSSSPKLSLGSTFRFKMTLTFSGRPDRFERKKTEAMGRISAANCQSWNVSAKVSRTVHKPKYAAALGVNNSDPSTSYFVVGTGTVFNTSSIDWFGSVPFTHDSVFMITLCTKADTATSFTSSGTT